MRRADVVIGAGFGDEGKGLVTDSLAAKYGLEAIVVRFNGGAQAGHSVELPSGKRHVFGHFGSGSFVGAATYLSRFFICNPLLFFREKPKLNVHSIAPVVYADENCPVTSPYDMMINQIVEETRQTKRHGSCGVGFGETIERNNFPGYAFTVRDLSNRNTLKKKLLDIRQNWVVPRLRKLGIEFVSEEWQARLSSDEILECYLVSIEQFLDYVTPTTIDMLKRRRPVIFEGAQGLLLDQDKGWFPHVTRSNTGLKNVVALAKDAGFDTLDVTYATRAYATRHGAGPLPHELKKLPYSKIVDPTNITNPYQGTLRFGWLDLDLLSRSVMTDMHDNASDGITLRHRLAVTCMDQIDDQVSFVVDDQLQSSSPEEFLQQVLRATHAEYGLASYGPTRKNIISFESEPDIVCLSRLHDLHDIA